MFWWDLFNEACKRVNTLCRVWPETGITVKYGYISNVWLNFKHWMVLHISEASYWEADTRGNGKKGERAHGKDPPWRRWKTGEEKGDLFLLCNSL